MQPRTLQLRQERGPTSSLTNELEIGTLGDSIVESLHKYEKITARTKRGEPQLLNNQPCVVASDVHELTECRIYISFVERIQTQQRIWSA